MKIKNLPKKIYLNICSNEDEVDYNELNGVTFSTEKIGVTDCDTENVPYKGRGSYSSPISFKPKSIKSLSNISFTSLRKLR